MTVMVLSKGEFVLYGDRVKRFILKSEDRLVEVREILEKGKFSMRSYIVGYIDKVDKVVYRRRNKEDAEKLLEELKYQLRWEDFYEEWVFLNALVKLVEGFVEDKYYALGMWDKVVKVAKDCSRN
jgi:hypothetical protein